MFGGQMACEALNWVLKRLIQEERPRRELGRHKYLGSADRTVEMYGKGYGMPSSHAQFVAFFSLSLTLFLLLRHNPHHPDTTSSTHVPTSILARLALSTLALGGAAAVALSRIYLNYHTERQVYAGCLAGAAFAILWFGATTAARHFGLVDWALDTPIARYARLRDLVVNEDLVDAGWERWELQRRKRQEMKNQ